MKDVGDVLKKFKLQKCHIIPDSLGGLDDPSNLVLLCNRCHREAPNVKDEEIIWKWLKAYKQSAYDCFWVDRAYCEYKRIFNREPFSSLNDDEKASICIIYGY